MAAVERLSVWPVAQQLAREQRRNRYLPESSAHPGKMLPALAREAIRRYTDPGDLVLDPMCGIGTTPVEAAHLNRQAIGVELEPRWAALAADNIRHAETQDAAGSAIALQGDARRLGRGLLNDYRDRFALILTSPPYGPSTHGHVRKHADHVEKLNDRYSRNPENLAHLPARRGPRSRRPAFDDVVGEILAGCAGMLDPKRGRLVLTVRPYRQQGALVDLPGQLVALAERKLLCGLRGSGLALRASFFQLYHQRAGTIERMLLIAHEDVLIFKRRPPSSRRNKRGGRR